MNTDDFYIPEKFMMQCGLQKYLMEYSKENNIWSCRHIGSDLSAPTGSCSRELVAEMLLCGYWQFTGMTEDEYQTKTKIEDEAVELPMKGPELNYPIKFHHNTGSKGTVYKSEQGDIVVLWSFETHNVVSTRLYEDNIKEFIKKGFWIVEASGDAVYESKPLEPLIMHVEAKEATAAVKGLTEALEGVVKAYEKMTLCLKGEDY